MVRSSRNAEVLRQSLRLKTRFHDRLGIALCFEGLAWVAAGAGDVRRAATLLGANTPVARELGLSLGKYRHLLEHLQRCRQRIREGDQEVVRRAHDEGAALPVGDAVAYALDEPAAPPAGAREDRRAHQDPLTRRERVVAELVAGGLSNREIAARLVISPRTAEGHVENILVKLGFSVRAQIAAWFTERAATTGED